MPDCTAQLAAFQILFPSFPCYRSLSPYVLSSCATCSITSIICSPLRRRLCCPAGSPEGPCSTWPRHRLYGLNEHARLLRWPPFNPYSPALDLHTHSFISIGLPPHFRSALPTASPGMLLSLISIYERPTLHVRWPCCRVWEWKRAVNEAAIPPNPPME